MPPHPRRKPSGSWRLDLSIRYEDTLTRPRQWENPHSIPIPRLDARRPYDPLAMPPHSRTLTPHCIAPT